MLYPYTPTFYLVNYPCMNTLMKRLLWTQILALSLLVLLLYPQSGRYWQIIRWLLAFVFLLYIPWYRLSYIFFARHELSHFERYIMSFALSLAIVFFGSFYLQYFQIPLFPIHIYVLSLVMVVFSFAILSVRARRKHKKSSSVTS